MVFRREIQTLIDRHCRRKFVLEGLLSKAEAVRAEMDALEREILLLYPGFSPDDWPAFKTKPKIHNFPKSAWARGAFRTLRHADRPMSAREIGQVVLADLGVTDMRRLLVNAEAGAMAAMKRAERKRLVVRVGTDPVRWKRAF